MEIWKVTIGYFAGSPDKPRGVVGSPNKYGGLFSLSSKRHCILATLIERQACDDAETVNIRTVST